MPARSRAHTHVDWARHCCRHSGPNMPIRYNKLQMPAACPNCNCQQHTQPCILPNPGTLITLLWKQQASPETPQPATYALPCSDSRYSRRPTPLARESLDQGCTVNTTAQLCTAAGNNCCPRAVLARQGPAGGNIFFLQAFKQRQHYYYYYDFCTTNVTPAACCAPRQLSNTWSHTGLLLGTCTATHTIQTDRHNGQKPGSMQAAAEVAAQH